MSGDARPDWVSQRAVAWVLDDAPVPTELLATLVAIARRCDENGRGSRQTVATIAAKAGKSPKQAQRDIVRLRQLGLLVAGDESLVAHLPMGQRPTVYDAPLHVKGPKPLKESRNKSGGRKDDDPTAPLEGTPPIHGTPPTEGGPTTPMQGDSTPPLEGGQKKPLNNPKKNPSLSAPELDALPAVADDRERERGTLR